MSSSFVYPASILLYILLFGLAMMRCRTITRAAGASLIATIVALLVWVFISAVDQYYGGPLVAMMTGWFGMQSIIVEETSLNIIAVLGGVLAPSLHRYPLHRHPFHEAQGAEVPQLTVARRRIQGRRFDTPAAFFRLLDFGGIGHPW